MTKVILKRGREESLRRFHPWVFSGAIAQITGNPSEGDIVGVYSSDGTFMAWGHYQIGSIAVRILSFDSDVQSPDFWEIMIRRALSVRIAAGLAADPESGSGRSEVRTDCYRLVHGEGDNLPGLIIDFYDGVCVLQAHSVGMFRSRKQISDALRKVFGESLKAVYDKSSGTAPFKAGLDLVDGYMYRREGFSSDESAVLENGHRFIVNWASGQKTGFFLDQRENRALVERYANGRYVLNLFCYTGGFSVYALAGGARHVDSVDSSAKAMDLVARNVRENGFDESCHTGYCCDAIDFLKTCPEEKYDLMVVDPPAFAKHRGALKNALRAYQRLNAYAISKVAPGGLVFTYSCSQVVDKESFALAVFSAAAQTGRSVRILDRLNQPADHSVNIYHPEGEYLKGLLLYVE
ncbi:MAG: class I SAM-dependent rRNA methyltransferase [Bacteroidetes bacterium]|uniref:Class I SAM-dependent rRNA methyltransferase n=1 Tax=Candidatus Cryptobacteroides excrementipullorum TaxID=2840761 RepID=A0A9D9NLR9_9BACT|nr:class I SAM-dependent rRNA methyltransferase [Candidatus Cryptobacteroides excrementipullorum]